ncbi:hypothetical protein [Marinobacter sp. CHS3-4]|uniref:hypothetical protein n=1 Tax=Marinobacter sp. CHS3-4 TaxID=3045174 RepID=UPI0024B62877|nr:hypothetical protein [Marinobacter sp. CHS3-4]MDI9244231.1 hypothetical protein [Marinobacter sp. CHS3-4]
MPIINETGIDMIQLRYPFTRNWLFYLLVFAYAILIGRMTFALWLGDGINVFASYSSAVSAAPLVVDANYVYWSKTCFLFLTMLLVSLNIDYRFAVGSGCFFWATSLILMFGTSPVLLTSAILGLLIAGIQVKRREVLDAR